MFALLVAVSSGIAKVIIHRGKSDYELTRKRKDGLRVTICKHGLTEKVWLD